ncbi:MAG: GDSL-type esterase/lipase family protein [Kiritimatiellae bacterium]|nr:GDSL-type esterase/lipase family protein [Kiritimatiellia bacterium]
MDNRGLVRLVVATIAMTLSEIRGNGAETVGFRMNGTNDLTVINRGRCGQNSGVVRDKFGADVLAMAPKPDYAFIYVGMNDVINDGFFTPLDKYLENMTWLIERSREAGITPVICTIHHVNEDVVYAHHPREKFGAETVTAKMDRYNAALRTLAAHRKVGLADFGVVADRTPPSELLSDGVHLTRRGNELLARTFLDVVASRLRGRETIVCLGDSLTYGYLNAGAGTADGETYPAMLRRLPLPAGQ